LALPKGGGPASVQPPLASEYDRLKVDMDESIGGIALLALAQEGTNRQDLTYVNAATRWDARLATLAALAAQQAHATGLGQDVLYAAFRCGLPSASDALALVPSATFQQALTKATKAGIVNLSDQQIASAVSAFQSFASKTLLASTAAGAPSTYNELVQAEIKDPAQQTAFANLYFTQPTAGSQFWTQAANLGIPGVLSTAGGEVLRTAVEAGFGIAATSAIGGTGTATVQVIARAAIVIASTPFQDRPTIAKQVCFGALLESASSPAYVTMRKAPSDGASGAADGGLEPVMPTPEKRVSPTMAEAPPTPQAAQSTLVRINAGQLRRDTARLIQGKPNYHLRFLVNQNGRFTSAWGLTDAEQTNPNLLQTGHVLAGRLVDKQCFIQRALETSSTMSLSNIQGHERELQ
jgi:hypothetical protein